MLNRRLRRTSRLLKEDVNPMEGAINIVDAMLVFACGLMLSLVIYWNVDLEEHKMVSIDQGEDVTEVEGVQEGVQGTESGQGDYQRMGTVYRDPATGKLYMLEE